MLEKKENFCQRLNPFWQCRKYRIPLWQCPSFLFLVMGIVIIGAILIIYYIASLRIDNPKIVSMIVLFAATVLLVIDFIITRSFERISEANRMKTEFIDIISHQLRSPLTNLKFSLEILVNDELKNITKEQGEYFQVLKENIQRMSVLIDNLLLVSRIETGILPLERQEFSLGELTKKIILKFKAYSEASNVKLSLKTPKTLPNVFADPLWLGQIIENLLDNAVRYIKGEGRVEIKIFLKGKEVCFRIKDTGVGIPKEEQKYIFKKFFRSKNIMKHQTEGSGLGLYIAKKIIELLGGKIWFESKEGKGTTFYFTLPITRETKVA